MNMLLLSSLLALAAIYPHAITAQTINPPGFRFTIANLQNLADEQDLFVTGRFSNVPSNITSIEFASARLFKIMGDGRTQLIGAADVSRIIRMSNFEAKFSLAVTKPASAPEHYRIELKFRFNKGADKIFEIGQLRRFKITSAGNIEFATTQTAEMRVVPNPTISITGTVLTVVPDGEYPFQVSVSVQCGAMGCAVIMRTPGLDRTRIFDLFPFPGELCMVCVIVHDTGSGDSSTICFQHQF